MIRFFRMLKNKIIQRLVYQILGDSFTIRQNCMKYGSFKIGSLDYQEVQIIDMRRRIPYEWWKVEKVHDLEIKLSRCVR